MLAVTLVYFQGSISTFVSNEFNTNSPSGFNLETTIKMIMSRTNNAVKHKGNGYFGKAF